MTEHPFDARILALSEHVSGSLEKLSDVVTHQMKGLSDVIEKLAVAPKSECEDGKFAALKSEFEAAAGAIRRSLSEPNGSRTDQHDLEQAAEAALAQAYANTVVAQQELFSLSIAALSQAAHLRLND